MNFYQVVLVSVERSYLTYYYFFFSDLGRLHKFPKRSVSVFFVFFFNLLTLILS